MAKLIDSKVVREKLGGISTSTFYRLLSANPAFPKARRISERRTAWEEAEIDAFIAALPIAEPNHDVLAAANAAPRKRRRGRPRKLFLLAESQRVVPEPRG